MTLWFAIVLMTAVSVTVVLWPLRRRGTLIRSGSGCEVCRVQPADIGQDRASGSIGKADVNAVVVEASRRALAAAESDVMAGDATLFMRRDGVEAAWEFVMPILDAWGQSRERYQAEYRAGTGGPLEAERLIEADGRHWRVL